MFLKLFFPLFHGSCLRWSLVPSLVGRPLAWSTASWDGPRRWTFPVFFLLSFPVLLGLCSTESSYPPPRFSHISMIFSHIHSPSISFCPFCCVLLLEQTWFLFSCYLKHASFPTVFPFSFLACGSRGGATLPCAVIS